MVTQFKVLHVIRPSTGGMKNHLFALMKETNKDLFHLTLACPSGEMVIEAAALGIEAVPLPLKGELSPGLDIRTICRLAKILKDKGINILHAHSSKAALVGRLAAAAANTPVVIMTAHNSIFYEEWPRWKRRTFALAERILSARTDMIITVSNALRKEILEREGLDSKKLVTIYNGIYHERYSAAGERLNILKSLGLPPLGNVVGTIARLAPQKGIKYFLQAAAILANRCQANFLIVGDGPLRRELENEATSLGLAQRVFFAGERRDIPDILPAFDVFVLPSVTEGFPLTILEAMASARPLVSTNVGGIPEAVKDNYSGLLVPPRDPVELARAISILLNDRERAHRLGETARRELAGNFTTTVMVRKVEKMYLQLLCQKNILPLNHQLGKEYPAINE